MKRVFIVLILVAVTVGALRRQMELIGDSTVIGNRRILMFEDAPVSDVVRIVIRQSRSVPVLRSVSLYA